MTGKPLGLFLALGVLAGCAHGPSLRPSGKEDELVEAEGWTPLDASKPLETRRRALAEAQKNAVEKVMGVTVSATTKVEAAVTLEQKIRANIGGYIRRYEILSERADDGFLKMRIRALVLYRPPPAAQAEAGRTIAVVSDDPGVGAAVRAALSANGFALRDQTVGNDLVVTALTAVYPVSDPNLGSFRSFRAAVTLNARESRTGAVSQDTREAAALDLVSEVAREKAAARAGTMAGEALAARLKAGSGAQ